jgi:hypothetical protein
VPLGENLQGGNAKFTNSIIMGNEPEQGKRRVAASEWKGSGHLHETKRPGATRFRATHRVKSNEPCQERPYLPSGNFAGTSAVGIGVASLASAFLSPAGAVGAGEALPMITLQFAEPGL